MRVRIERANLLKALNHVHRVVERRNTIPILANVLIKAQGSELSLKATDLDMEVDRAGCRRAGREHGTRTCSMTLCESCPMAPRSRSTRKAGRRCR
jgi:DNA polymerase-3 subunit beta